MATKKTASAKPARSSSKTKKTAKKKSTSSPKQRTAKRKGAAGKSKAGDEEVKIDRRRSSRRKEDDGESASPAPKIERREKVQRRRQIDPTTCERDYSDAEVEFMNAMDEYKRRSGRMFPTCSEVLEVIRDLGYVQLSLAGRALLEQSNLADGELIEGEATADVDQAAAADPTFEGENTEDAAESPADEELVGAFG